MTLTWRQRFELVLLVLIILAVHDIAIVLFKARVTPRIVPMPVFRAPLRPFEIRVDRPGQEWLRLQTPGGRNFQFVYQKAQETRPDYNADNLPAGDALRITPGNPELHISPLLTRSGAFYVGFNNDVTCPGTGVPYSFGTMGDILVGDLWVIERNPIQVARRHIPLRRAVTTNFYSNRNINSDDAGGAGITLVSDEEGPVNSGYINLVAYGRGTGPLANSIRFMTRAGTNRIADRMIVKGDGRVGIGTTKPQAKLDVNGRVRIGSPQNPQGLILFDRKGKGYLVEIREGKLVATSLQQE